MSKINKNILLFYLAYVCMVISISLPHAVLTVLLLKKGLSLSQILIVQSVYSFTILVSEYPSGLLADLYSKKKLFLISKVCLIVMFFLIMKGNSLIFMILAWIFYGLSTALDSGTIDAEIINTLKYKNNDSKVARFISNINRLDFISLIIGGSIGSWLYYRVGIKFYYLSICLVLICIILICKGYKSEFHPDYTIHVNSKSIFVQIKSGIRELRESSKLRLMIYLTFVNQFFFQTHFQLWQALFLSKNINKTSFYLYYIIFQIISILAYSLNFSLTKKNISIFYVISSVTMFLGILSIQSINNILFVLSYCTLVFIFMFFDYFSNVLFSQNVSTRNISSLTSLKSSCGRIASLTSLIISSALINIFSTEFVVTMNFIFAIVASVFVLFIFLKKTEF